MCALAGLLIIRFWIEIRANFHGVWCVVFIEPRRFREGARSVGPGLGARLHLGPPGDVAPTTRPFGRFLNGRPKRTGAHLRAMEATRPAGDRRGAPGSVLRLDLPPPLAQTRPPSSKRTTENQTKARRLRSFFLNAVQSTEPRCAEYWPARFGVRVLLPRVYPNAQCSPYKTPPRRPAGR